MKLPTSYGEELFLKSLQLIRLLRNYPRFTEPKDSCDRDEAVDTTGADRAYAFLSHSELTGVRVKREAKSTFRTNNANSMDRSPFLECDSCSFQEIRNWKANCST